MTCPDPISVTVACPSTPVEVQVTAGTLVVQPTTGDSTGTLILPVESLAGPGTEITDSDGIIAGGGDWALPPIGEEERPPQAFILSAFMGDAVVTPSGGDALFDLGNSMVESVTVGAGNVAVILRYLGVWRVIYDSAASGGGGTAGASMYQSETPPVDPNDGDLWFRTDDGKVFTWYDGYWVATDFAGLTGLTGPAGPTGEQGPTGDAATLPVTLSTYCVSAATALEVETAVGEFYIPAELDGYTLASCTAAVLTAQSTGTPVTVMLTRLRLNGTDPRSSDPMLTDPLTIDNGDVDATQSASPAVIDPTVNDVSAGDLIQVDVTQIGDGTAQGLVVCLTLDPPD